LNLGPHEIVLRPCVGGITLVPVTGTTYPLTAPSTNRRRSRRPALLYRCSMPYTTIEVQITERTLITPTLDRRSNQLEHQPPLDHHNDHSWCLDVVGARLVLLKNPIDLAKESVRYTTRDQTIQRWEVYYGGYQLKESLYAVFPGDLDPTDTSVMLDRWYSKVQQSRIH
jgi:hypothetical protein